MKIYKVLFLILMLMTLNGCALMDGTYKNGVFEKKEASLQITKTQIQTTQNQIRTNDDKRLEEISEIAWATQQDLNTDTNSTEAIRIAKELNDRIESLVGNTPSIDDMALMNKMISQLQESNTTILNQQDGTIKKLQSTIQILDSKLSTQDSKLSTQESGLIQLGQKNTEILSTYQGWFGLKAIFTGSKHLLIWIMVIFVIFFILKIASEGNPIAAGIFGVFESIGGTVIKIISKVVGKGAIECAGFCEVVYRDTLGKLVSSIEVSKTQSSGGATVQVSDVLNQIATNTDASHKAIISSLLTTPSPVPPVTATLSKSTDPTSSVSK